VFNRVQRRFAKMIVDQMSTRGYVRMVVLKARQQGLSTVISAWQYWWLSQREAQKGLVMAHEGEATNTLLNMYKRVHDNVPTMLRPHTKYNSKNELTFDVLDSALRVATAGGRGVARGETLQTTHLSEVAFWPVAFANENFNGLIEAVPDEPGTAVFVESTAQGMTGKFRDLWVDAIKMGYVQFFSAWFESDEYRTPAPADFVPHSGRRKLLEQFAPLLNSNDQLFWRRRRLPKKVSGCSSKSTQRHPTKPSSRQAVPVFNPDYLHERLSNPTAPLQAHGGRRRSWVSRSA
jgi:hypothetical protein